jgi:type II secretory pathway predicted ATPase ExeA/septal ring-binding cell division protein DamX
MFHEYAINLSQEYSIVVLSLFGENSLILLLRQRAHSRRVKTTKISGIIMREIHKDLESSERSPFQEEILLENYFAGANRGEVLSQMKEAMQDGVTLMVLTGEEGSGKTMMCRLLVYETSLLSKTVFFSRTVDSFEDVVRVLARELGVDAIVESDGRNVDQTLESIIDFLLSESLDLLIIFDEAENIYLATLERIRKMLDRIIKSGARIHILFSGRETFLENCDQLSFCDFNMNEQLHFALTPLSEVETGDYLKDCAVRLPGIDAAEVFADEVIDSIYTLAKGNFKKTNILGEESVRTPGVDTSFMLSLENYKEGNENEERKTGFIKSAALKKVFITYLPWGGGVACCLLLLLFLFGRGNNEREDTLDIDQTQKTETTNTLTVTPEMNFQHLERNEPVMAQPAEERQTQEEKVGAVQVPDDNEPGEEEVIAPVEQSSHQEFDQAQGEVKRLTGGTAERIESETDGDVGVKVVVAKAKEIQDPQEVVTGEMGSRPLLHPSQDQKKKPDLSSETIWVKIKANPRAKIQTVVALNATYTVDQLYKERLLAGLGWKRGKKENMYTVQLMALASTSAEENLKKLLAEDRYRQVAGNFYIFQKEIAPKNIIVFYGEYPSIEKARLIKDSLPGFLRDYKPYVLSIKGAIAKVRK